MREKGLTLDVDHLNNHGQEALLGAEWGTQMPVKRKQRAKRSMCAAVQLSKGSSCCSESLLDS